ncbi:hypothetical protein Tco_0347615 [Tanacetum coccineum]
MDLIFVLDFNPNGSLKQSPPKKYITHGSVENFLALLEIKTWKSIPDSNDVSRCIPGIGVFRIAMSKRIQNEATNDTVVKNDAESLT